MNPNMFKATTKISSISTTAAPGSAGSSFLFGYGREILVGVILVGLILAGSKLSEESRLLTIKQKEALLATIVPPDLDSLPAAPVNPYAGLNLEAKAAIVFDITNETVLFEKNSNVSLPLASVTKLMTALVVDELLAPDAIITIGVEAIKMDGDSGFLVGEKFARQDLSDLTLTTSSNDGAYALAEAAGNVLISGLGSTAFVETMNIRADAIGLEKTEFYNPTGLDESRTQSGSLGTASDIAKLLNYIITNHNQSLLAATTKEKIQVANTDGAVHTISNTSYNMLGIPGLIASKTGFTELAGGNLAIVYDTGLGHLIAVVVLGSSRSGRFSDVETLVALTNKQFVK